MKHGARVVHNVFNIMQSYNLRKRKLATTAYSHEQPAVPRARGLLTASSPASNIQCAEIDAETDCLINEGSPPSKTTSPVGGDDVGLKLDTSQYVLGATPASTTPTSSLPTPASTLLPARGFTLAKLDAACQHLSSADERLAPLIQQHGPPLRLLAKLGTCCFASLAKSIVFQQLATGAAAAIYSRVLRVCQCGEQLSAAALMGADARELRGAGLSERKVTYLLDLSRHFQEGHLSDELIASWDDSTLQRELTKVKGIGAWTCDMFAMFHLGHPDILPTGDLGVRRGMQVLYNLKDLPDPAAMERVAERWRPYRSAGCYYMWRVEVPKGTQLRKEGTKARAKPGEGRGQQPP